MVGNAVADLTPDDAPLQARVAVAVKLAFLTGLLQMGMGLLKMGEVASLVSHPVMQGFSSGGEILIAISQIKWIFGIKIPQQRYAWQTLFYLFAHIRETEPWTLLLGIVTCALLFVLSKWRRVTKVRMEVRGRGSPRSFMSESPRLTFVHTNATRHKARRRP
jgi:SulP family sulfate permease